MGRLIDESELIDIIQGSDEITNYQKDECITWIRACNTAYDPEKVVEQLEELKSLVPVNRILDDIVNEKQKELGMLMAYEKAIEIVKAGGTDDTH